MEEKQVLRICKVTIHIYIYICILLHIHMLIGKYIQQVMSVSGSILYPNSEAFFTNKFSRTVIFSDFDSF